MTSNQLRYPPVGTALQHSTARVAVAAGAAVAAAAAAVAAAVAAAAAAVPAQCVVATHRSDEQQPDNFPCLNHA